MNDKVQAAKPRSEIVNETLEKSKGQFDEVMVVGLKGGSVDIATSIPTYQFTQWLLSRAAFELNISEKAAQNTGTE